MNQNSYNGKICLITIEKLSIMPAKVRKRKQNAKEKLVFLLSKKTFSFLLTPESARVTSGSLHVQARKPNITGWTNPMHK